jgi:shikimate dehydrogenase
VLNRVKKLISNTIVENNIVKKYSLIIGESPSKGARSPLLWNAAYAKHKIQAKMYPADVLKKNIKKLIKALYLDKNFSAAVITNPYKEIVYKLLKKNSSILAKKIKSTNCIYKKGSLFYITNTDSEASFLAVKKKISLKEKHSILILGFGGAGKAVALAFNQFLRNKKIYVATRKEIKNKHKGLIFINWKKIDNIIKDITVCINCTTVGFGPKIIKSPLSLDQLKKLNKKTIVYDIIYNPKTSVLLKNSKKNKLKTINGIRMNLFQAALAFNLANSLNRSDNKTFYAMNNIK